MTDFETDIVLVPNESNKEQKNFINGEDRPSVCIQLKTKIWIPVILSFICIDKRTHNIQISWLSITMNQCQS